MRRLLTPAALALAAVAAVAYVELNDVWYVYLNGTEAASPAYRITPVESNATHMIYRIEVRVPDVRIIYVYKGGGAYLYIKLP